VSFEVIIPFFRPIRHLLESNTVSEIMVNPDGTVWIEEAGHMQTLPDIHFEEGALLTVACPIFCAIGRVSVAQLFLSASSRRRGCGEVGSA